MFILWTQSARLAGAKHSLAMLEDRTITWRVGQEIPLTFVWKRSSGEEKKLLKLAFSLDVRVPAAHCRVLQFNNELAAIMNTHFRYVFCVAALGGMLSAVPSLAASSSSLTCPAPATGAFTGCYYNNMTLSGDPAFVRTDSQINFYWGNGSPDPSLQPLDFSIRWEGNFMFSQGNYTFTVV